MKKKILILGLLSFITTISEDTVSTNCALTNIGKNLWQGRPFSSHPSREIMMMHSLYNNYYKHDDWHGTLSTLFEYSQNFGCPHGDNSLGAMPFWSGTNTMTIGKNDGESDIDAYQFGMGDATSPGSITIAPKIQYLGTDLMLHFTRDKHDRGFFFKLKCPLATMRVYTNVSENPATLNHAVDRAWISYPSPTNQYKTMTEAFAAGDIFVDESLDIVTQSTDTTPGPGKPSVQSVLHRPVSLERGRIVPCTITSTRLADPSITLGYNILGSAKGFLGMGIKATVPTGTIPTGIYVFEPIVGHAGHWGLGIDMTGHYKYWLNEDKARGLDFWIQGEMLHLFAGRTPNMRSFDLKQNGPGSKYMLLQFYFPSNPPTTSTSISENGRVPSFITQAVNITTIPVKTSYLIDGNLAFNVNYQQKNWDIGLGLEIWGRTKEILRLDGCNMLKNQVASFNDFAVLGRQISEDSTNNPIQELYYCEPLATISKSENRRIVYDPSKGSGVYTDKIKDARLAENRIPANITDALDFAGGAEKRAIAGKVSMHTGYTWKQCKYSPNMTLYSNVEMTVHGNTRVNFWSAGIHGSLTF